MHTHTHTHQPPQHKLCSHNVTAKLEGEGLDACPLTTVWIDVTLTGGEGLNTCILITIQIDVTAAGGEGLDTWLSEIDVFAELEGEGLDTCVWLYCSSLTPCATRVS